MVCYCCVKDCENKSTSGQKKDCDTLISFHAFPANPELKRKWLRAIGRADWKPPKYARVCSAHFNPDQIVYIGYRPKVLEDALPVNLLPPNSYFEASDVEVCRICLATDVNLESLLNTQLGSCMNALVGCLPNYDVDGLPQFVCQQCALNLMACSELIKKCIASQATLHDIFAKHGQVTKNLIKEKDQTQDSSPEANLTSTYNKSSSIKEFLNKFEDDLFKTNSENDAKEKVLSFKDEDICIKIEQIDTEPKCKDELDMINVNELQSNEDVLKAFNENDLELNEDVLKEDVLNVNDLELNAGEIKEDLMIINDLDVKEPSEIGSISDNDEDIDDSGSISSTGSCNSDDSSSDSSTDSILEEVKRTMAANSTKRFVPKKVDKGLTPCETEMQQYYDIVELQTLEEQIQEWEKGSIRPPAVRSKNVYKCETCNKLFGNIVNYHIHTTSHDPVLGPAECPVCKLRFKSETLAASHVRRDHSKKFVCKSCPKVFTNAGVAKKHHRLHMGHEYKCSLCPFVTRHQSNVGVHQRMAHSDAHVCSRCGKAFHTSRGLEVHTNIKHRTLREEKLTEKVRCEQCDVGFVSEEALRVHILTSKQHSDGSRNKRASSEEQKLRNCCKICGHQCKSRRELIQHKRTEHPGVRSARRSNHPWKGKVPYPVTCELCGESISTRRHHWQHMRCRHPTQKNTYQAVIAAICDICGKGCQSTALLRLHELRHRSPTIRCPLCPRMFYDKYALMRHDRTHKAEKPYQCRICGRAFKVSGNLDRHSKVHTDNTPFECTMCGKKFKYSSSVKLHVRTVHFKQPHPPRRKRTKGAKDAIDS